ncbi:uncharacterized protein BXZ73DRAFT_106879 [Epithele typhae]|uniref:uncharacterized protein n=1 Tax=Epithele typhae TaxID=378194 RepID=UPI002007751B|nr:uncharacterized protein BXZ73DRAFT_106879 [Epithele typhae]KAH9913700.1 hypothetical protein BXZ73DRAFT_106879 [Epithele typhae]
MPAIESSKFLVSCANGYIVDHGFTVRSTVHVESKGAHPHTLLSCVPRLSLHLSHISLWSLHCSPPLAVQEAFKACHPALWLELAPSGHREACTRFITHLFACPDLSPLSTSIPPAVPLPLANFIAYALHQTRRDDAHYMDVFADTGLPRAASLLSGFWSGFVHLRRAVEPAASRSKCGDCGGSGVREPVVNVNVCGSDPKPFAAPKRRKPVTPVHGMMPPLAVPEATWRWAHRAPPSLSAGNLAMPQSYTRHWVSPLASSQSPIVNDRRQDKLEQVLRTTDLDDHRADATSADNNCASPELPPANVTLEPRVSPVSLVISLADSDAAILALSLAADDIARG